MNENELVRFINVSISISYFLRFLSSLISNKKINNWSLLEVERERAEMKDQVKGTNIRNVRFPFDGFVTLKRLFCWLCRALVDDEESEKKEGTHIRAHTFFFFFFFICLLCFVYPFIRYSVALLLRLVVHGTVRPCFGFFSLFKTSVECVLHCAFFPTE